MGGTQTLGWGVQTQGLVECHWATCLTSCCSVLVPIAVDRDTSGFGADISCSLAELVCGGKGKNSETERTCSAEFRLK